MSQKQSSFLNNWTEIGGPDSGIVRELSTGREGERRIIALDPLYDPSNQQFIYNTRKQTKLPYVGAYGSELLKLQKPPKSPSKDKNAPKEVVDPYNHLAVVTERIPHRLVDAPQLTYPESLYVLARSLEGFENAYEKCGSMRVNDRMIGFNNQGQCKVWVNQDFANNHPSYPRRKLMSTRVDSKQYLQGVENSLHRTSSDEADMVQDIVDTVQNYSQQGRFPEPFASRIHQSNLSFSDARNIVQNTIQEGKIPVPNRVDLFTNRVRGYRKFTQTTTTNTTNIPQTTFIPPTTTTTTTRIPQFMTTTTENRRSSQGYKFNYMPVEREFSPQIFASRVGEHGVYKGIKY